MILGVARRAREIPGLKVFRDPSVNPVQSGLDHSFVLHGITSFRLILPAEGGKDLHCLSLSAVELIVTRRNRGRFSCLGKFSGRLTSVRSRAEAGMEAEKTPEKQREEV
jgi:hypothetical protein